ncbi:hypothetical protein GF325_16140 [Candidatus Bathyarchaeota archaeon]|nr:hypothetical protein [Candidatus Bathyarchaeota archaeon]
MSPMKSMQDDDARLRAVRPPIPMERPILPSREEVIARKSPVLKEIMSGLDELGGKCERKHASVTDEIILSLIWNNEALSDVPELVATSGDGETPAHVEGERQSGINGINEVDTSDDEQVLEPLTTVREFLNPPRIPGSLISQDMEKMHKNAGSLFKFAMQSSYRKILREEHERNH